MNNKETVAADVAAIRKGARNIVRVIIWLITGPPLASLLVVFGAHVLEDFGPLHSAPKVEYKNGQRINAKTGKPLPDSPIDGLLK